MSHSLAIIGAGNMGASLCRGLMKDMLDLSLSIADRDAEALKEFSGVQTSTNAQDIIASAECVLIAVKPQSFAELCDQLGSSLSDTLIISIMAGKTLKVLEEKTGSSRIVRAMPNLGVKVGRSVTAWIPSSAVGEDDCNLVGRMFDAVGKGIRLQDEQAIERFTALVGCGPAYFFHLCSLLEKRARAMGFSEEDARCMAEETFVASAHLLDGSELSGQQWSGAVASKGGVTQEALNHLENNGLEDLLAGALDAAIERSKQLSD